MPLTPKLPTLKSQNGGSACYQKKIGLNELRFYQATIGVVAGQRQAHKGRQLLEYDEIALHNRQLLEFDEITLNIGMQKPEQIWSKQQLLERVQLINARTEHEEISRKRQVLALPILPYYWKRRQICAPPPTMEQRGILPLVLPPAVGARVFGVERGKTAVKPVYIFIHPHPVGDALSIK